MPHRSETSAHRMPRWVRVTVIVALVMAAIVIAALLSGHGPWQHFQSVQPTASVAP